MHKDQPVAALSHVDSECPLLPTLPDNLEDIQRAHEKAQAMCRHNGEDGQSDVSRPLSPEASVPASC